MTETAATNQKSFSTGQVVAIALVVALVASGLTVWIWRSYFPSEFEPVALSEREERALDAKLARLEGVPARTARNGDRLEPEPYAETDTDREVRFNERELNALVANSPDLARRVAIDLSSDLVSARVLIPLDEDFPIMGGRTLRLRAGLELGYADGQPVVVLRGISIMGVPMPNAWLGGLKHIDLVREFGGEPGFWKAFAAGIDVVEVRDGELFVRVRE